VEQLKQLKTDMIERVLHHEKFVLSSFTPSVDRLDRSGAGRTWAAF
jgi:hypothetical protein